MRSHLILTAFTLLITAGSSAQVQDSMAYRRNIVKINMTSWILYNSAYLASYERVMKPGQSLGITAGYIQIPSLLGSGGVLVDRVVSKSGFTFGAEYRFYLQRENRYAAPRGVYIGPFASVHSFSNEWELRTTSSPSTPAALQSNITFTSIGFQVGYQFVINNRWTIDMIFFGPSMTNYNLELKLNGSFTPSEEDEVVNGIIDRFPFLGDLLEGETISANGKTSRWSGGYRYTFQIGYRFGARKNKGK